MRALCLVLLACFAIPAARAAVVDANWTEASPWRSIATGGNTGLAWAPDGSDRLFVLEKTGRVQVLSGALSGGPESVTTFATMSPIFTASECGLIGMAFDPDFVNNQLVYFFVTVSNTEQQIIRYDASGATGTGRTVIVSGLPTTGNNHDGGGIGFAHDGKLYWSIGDLGSGVGVDANMTSLASKVGRANRDGTLPPDNPFVDGAGPNNDFIFARGFRNPFTMQIQPSTGQIWLNVVGTSWEQVFVVGAGDHGGYNDFENNQTAAFITPNIVYPTGGVQSRVLTTAVRNNNIATFTTTQSHGFRVGSQVIIAGVADNSFNQNMGLYVTSVISTTQFTAAQPGPNASSTGGTSAHLSQGSCLTGGTFYDATAASAPYRGNFFYGDCTSGRVMRARIDAGTNGVTAVDHWATGSSGQVDIAVGPDGALYYTGSFGSAIRRASFNAAAQGLVVSNQHWRMDEEGDVVTMVSLAMAPANDVTVTSARTAGDAGVNVVAGGTLIFTPVNWMRPQAVRIAADGDVDLTDDAATVSVSSPGLATIGVDISVLDLGAMGMPDTIFFDGFENP